MAKPFDAIYDSLISTADERLSAQDEAAVRAEAEGTPAQPPPAPEAAEGEEATPVEAAPEAIEAPPATEAAAEPAVVESKPNDATEPPKKKLSPAQERITELVHERNELKRSLDEQREKWARIDERSRLVREQEERERVARETEQARYAAEHAAQQRAALRPDPNFDPVGARLWDAQEEARVARAETAALQQQVNGAINQYRVNQDVQTFTQSLQNDIQSRRQTQADYDEAATYATNTRKQFWLSLGHTEEVASQRVQQEALAVAAEALQNGKSPSAIYYDLAKQWGYKPGTNVTTQTGGMVSPKDRLAQVKAGQKVVGLGGTPNVADSEHFDIDNMTPAQFADLPEDRFLSMVSSPNEYKRLQKWLEKHELGIDR